MVDSSLANNVVANLPAILTAAGVFVAAVSSLINGYRAAARSELVQAKLDDVHDTAKEAVSIAIANGGNGGKCASNGTIDPISEVKTP